MPQDLAPKNLEILVKEFATQFQDIFLWQWDERFNTVQAEFSVDHLQSVFGLFNVHFKEAWDVDSIKTAPDYIQSSCNLFGRFHSDQVFSTTDSKCDEFVYCAIWPWGDGEMISIRLAPYSKTMSKNDMENLLVQFRHWFGL